MCIRYSFDRLKDNSSLSLFQPQSTLSDVNQAAKVRPSKSIVMQDFLYNYDETKLCTTKISRSTCTMINIISRVSRLEGFHCYALHIFPLLLDGNLRLVPGTLPTLDTGRLEIYIGGHWGAICNARLTFSPHAANISCKQLGFLRYNTYGNLNSLQYVQFAHHYVFIRYTCLCILILSSVVRASN